MNRNYAGRFLFFFILSLLITIISCAKLGSPPGGPEDREGATIVSTYPLKDSVNVYIDNRIVVGFDEKINSATIPGAVFISPRPEGEIKYKLKGQELNIVLPDSFSDSTTYIVTIGSQIRDLRGNDLDESYSFAFSTGPKIAEGKIKGKVFNGSKAASGVSVGLWPFEEIPSTGGIDTLYPPYVTQSGKEGDYQFEFIPNGQYLVLAFIDKNKDQKFNYPKETFGIPDRFPRIDDNAVVPEVTFNLTTEDTASGRGVLSVLPTSDNLVKVRFTGEISGDLIDDNLSLIKAVNLSDSSAVSAVAIKEPGSQEGTGFNFYFGVIPAGEYYIRLDNHFLAPNDTTTVISRNFKFNPDEDNQPPLLDSISHNQKAVFPSDSIIKIRFSEPIDQREPVTERIRIVDTLNGEELSYIPDWSDNFRLELSVSAIDWGQAYRIDMDERGFSDMAGNRLGDSLRSFYFTTYDIDSLGEISGVVEVDSSLRSSGVPNLELLDLSGNVLIREPSPTGMFRFTVAPGQYFLRGFLDRNNNQKLDPGSFRPFEFSETSARYPDTIRVRYRFETSGIVLNFK